LLVNTTLVFAHEHDFAETKQLIDSEIICDKLSDEQLEVKILALPEEFQEEIDLFEIGDFEVFEEATPCLMTVRRTNGN